MTCPGVPDFYQGTEAWDLNLVDPDNRRPVDYTLHMHLLNQLIEEITKGKSDFCDWLHRQRNTGQMKLFIIRKALHLRQKLPALFTDGDYIPLRTEGRHKDRLIAFARVNQGNHMLVIVPRLIAGLVAPGQFPIGAVWDDTRLHVPQYCQGQAIDIFTEKQINLQNEKEIAEILEKFPLSLICDSYKLCHNDLLSH
jgi:(1->4)-alpha-D-glucan 1-alpha-D-glucosylmutase